MIIYYQFSKVSKLCYNIDGFCLAVKCNQALMIFSI